MTSSQLPPELWRLVLQAATTPLRGFVTSWDYLPSERLFRGWDDIDFDDPTIQTKLAISLVCQAWHIIGAEFLYQWIVLNTPKQTQELTDVFRRSALPYRSALPKTPHGQWVRRVDVGMVVYCDAGNPALMSFLRQCSKVEIFMPTQSVNWMPYQSEPDLDHLLNTRFRHSLRHTRLRTAR